MHGVRHESEEVPHAHGWLKDLRAFAETYAVQSAPDGLDYLWRREMRIRCRCARRLILIQGEQSLQRRRRPSPLIRRGVAEYVGHGAPAHVAGEHGLFIIGGVT